MTTLWLRLAAAAAATLLLSGVGCTRPEVPWAGQEPNPAPAPAAAPARVDVTPAPVPVDAAPIAAPVDAAPAPAPVDADPAPAPSPVDAAPAPLDENQAIALVMALPAVDEYRRAVEARGWHVTVKVSETPSRFVVGIGESRDDRVALLLWYLVRRADGAVEPWDMIRPPPED